MEECGLKDGFSITTKTILVAQFAPSMPNFHHATQVQAQHDHNTELQIDCVMGLISGRMMKNEGLASLLGELVESWREALTLEGSEATSRLQKFPRQQQRCEFSRSG
jgi:hypothetical protein